MFSLTQVMFFFALPASLLASALLIDPRSVFYVDWNNHLWLIEYFGESIKHLKVPVMMNTPQLVGMPLPLFYSEKFYTLSGCLSALIGSALTVRIEVLAVLLFQFYQVYRSARKAQAPQSLAVGIAVLVTWAIYPLTDLYNRSAVTEFFAVAFLTCAVASFLVVICAHGKDTGYDMVASGLFFITAAVTHPLTGVFGGLFLGILGLTALVYCEQERRIKLTIFFLRTVFLSMLILSPWTYMLWQFNSKLPVSSPATNEEYFHHKYFFPKSIDNIFSRLSLFPLDLKSLKTGTQDKDSFTPYLDAQICLPLVVLIGVFFYSGFKGNKKFFLNNTEGAVFWTIAAIFIVVFIESICPWTLDFLGGFFNILQFPYRLVSYVNLSALIMAILLAGRMGAVPLGSKKLINVCMVFCLAISFSAVVEKLVHGAAVMQKSTKADQGIWAPLPFGSTRHLIDLPPSFYAEGAYSVKEGFTKGGVSGMVHYAMHNFKVLEGNRFGEVEGQNIELKEPEIVVTNVQPFPWNKIVINGALDYPYSIITFYGSGAVFLPPGDYHLEFQTAISNVWRSLYLLSWVLFIGWIAVCLFSSFDLWKEQL